MHDVRLRSVLVGRNTKVARLGFRYCMAWVLMALGLLWFVVGQFVVWREHYEGSLSIVAGLGAMFSGWQLLSITTSDEPKRRRS